MTTQDLAEHLGGRQALGRDIRSDLDLEDAVRTGLPVQAAESVVKTGALRSPELHALVIPRRTLAHRKRLGKRLSSQAIGGEWARRRERLLLRVPSVLVPEESNVLVNPMHPDAVGVRVIGSRPFSYDVRLLT